MRLNSNFYVAHPEDTARTQEWSTDFAADIKKGTQLQAERELRAASTRRTAKSIASSTSEPSRSSSSTAPSGTPKPFLRRRMPTDVPSDVPF